MKKYDAKQAIAIIIKTAKEYDKKLNNKHFLIVYHNKKISVPAALDFGT